MIGLKKNKIRPKRITKYRQFVSKDFINQLRSQANLLAGKKIIHLNSTPKGGGVAEILRSLISLGQSLDININWYSFKAPVKFFRITKRIHNGLQGAKVKISKKDLDLYLEINQKLARLLSRIDFDLAVIHDPQPLAIINYLHKAPLIARIHIDLSTPNRRLLAFFKPILKKYDFAVFSLGQFVPNGFPKSKTAIIEPAIDPLDPKNMPLGKNKYEDIIEMVGVDPQKPIVTQVSRFDPFKDPLGVIKAYFLAKEKIDDLQLVFVGFSREKDSPDAKSIYKKAVKFAQGDPDIHLFFDEEASGFKNDVLVNAFQSGSDIIIQKSTREGFGLTVTEAMYKGKIVIAGNAAGIKRQIASGKNGFIIQNPRQLARLMVSILKNKSRYRQIGARAARTVVNNFLITRLLADELSLYHQVLRKT